MSTTTTTAPAAAKPASIVSTVDANAANLVSREMTFFETHPKAIAIGCAATTAAIFLALHFGLGIL